MELVDVHVKMYVSQSSVTSPVTSTRSPFTSPVKSQHRFMFPRIPPGSHSTITTPVCDYPQQHLSFFKYTSQLTICLVSSFNTKHLPLRSCLKLSIIYSFHKRFKGNIPLILCFRPSSTWRPSVFGRDQTLQRVKWKIRPLR